MSEGILLGLAVACGKIVSVFTEIILAIMLHELKKYLLCSSIKNSYCQRVAFATLEENIGVFAFFLLSGTDTETSCFSTAQYYTYLLGSDFGIFSLFCYLSWGTTSAVFSAFSLLHHSKFCTIYILFLSFVTAPIRQ